MFTINTTSIHEQLLGAFQTAPRAALSLAIIAILVAISVCDIRTRQIPLPLSASLLLCGIPALFLYPDIGIASRLIGIFCVSVPLFILALAKRESIGMGDIKLLAGAGFLLGCGRTVTAFAVGSVLGGVLGIALLITRKASRTGHFAFGPCLCIGILAAYIS
jgi:leader peptidase (prepilin peptidase)/N-methyltransferase